MRVSLSSLQANKRMANCLDSRLGEQKTLNLSHKVSSKLMKSYIILSQINISLFQTNQSFQQIKIKQRNQNNDLHAISLAPIHHHNL